MAKALWRAEHGDNAAVPALIADDPRLRDISWHNDVCPSFVVADDPDESCMRRLWVDFADPNDREAGPDAPRFRVYDDVDLIAESDDPADIPMLIETLIARVQSTR